MRGAILPLLLFASCARLPEAGGGIVSTNPCADAMLIALVPPERIAAISHYSQEPSATSIPLAVANRFRATAGTAEEVIALRPDLVLTSSFTPLTTREAYARAGLRTLLLDSPATVKASEAQVMRLALAVGERAKGRALVGAIEGAVSFPSLPPPALLRRRPGPSWESASNGVLRFHNNRLETGTRPSPGKEKKGKESRRNPSALLYIAGDLATGSGTLLDELLTRAGFTNAAAGYGLAFTGTLPAERIVTRPPDVVIAPERAGRTTELRRRLLPTTPEATFPRTFINCGGPSIVPAMARLRAIRASL